MFDAQTIQMQGATSTDLYSPWFPRGGDYGLFTLEAIKMSTTSSALVLTVQMVSKNTSEPGDGANVGSSFNRDGSQIATTPRITSDVTTTGFEELVRYKFTLSNASGSGTNWAVFRMLAPVWYDKV
jgi:hypothetical protein